MLNGSAALTDGDEKGFGQVNQDDKEQEFSGGVMT